MKIGFSQHCSIFDKDICKYQQANNDILMSRKLQSLSSFNKVINIFKIYKLKTQSEKIYADVSRKA